MCTSYAGTEHLQKVPGRGSHCRADLVSLHGEGPDLLQVLSSVRSFDQTPAEISGVVKQKASQVAITPKLKQHKML